MKVNNKSSKTSTWETASWLKCSVISEEGEVLWEAVAYMSNILEMQQPNKNHERIMNLLLRNLFTENM